MTHVDQLHPRIQAVDLETGELTPFFFKYFVQLWERVGGPDDFIEDVQNGEVYEPGIADSRLIELEKRVQAIELDQDMANDSRIQTLERRIEELELQLEMLSVPSLTALEARVNELEIDTEINYGA